MRLLCESMDEIYENKKNKKKQEQNKKHTYQKLIINLYIRFFLNTYTQTEILSVYILQIYLYNCVKLLLITPITTIITTTTTTITATIPTNTPTITPIKKILSFIHI